MAPPSCPQRPRREPLYDINPLTGISIEVSTPTARWRHSAGAALVGFGSRAGAAMRQIAYWAVRHELRSVSARGGADGGDAPRGIG